MVTGIILAAGGGLCVGAVLGVAVIRPCVCQLDGHHTSHQVTANAPAGASGVSSGRLVWSTDQVEVMVAQARTDGQRIGAMEALLQAGRAAPVHVSAVEAATDARPVEGGGR